MTLAALGRFDGEKATAIPPSHNASAGRQLLLLASIANDSAPVKRFHFAPKNNCRRNWQFCSAVRCQNG
jgi:hypothetical protein